MNDGSDASETWLVALNPGPRKMKSYQDLQVWQKAMDLVGKVYRVTERLPREEAYGLTAQVRRSAISVPSNIAEGHARSATGDYLRHLSIAQGSLAELETQLILTERLGYLEAPEIRAMLDSSSEIGRMLNGLRRSLRVRSQESGARSKGKS